MTKVLQFSLQFPIISSVEKHAHNCEDVEEHQQKHEDVDNRAKRL
eukprot:CAMPEP_0114570240 /NCGR_PEP_ID=MMETSP0114-20121206/17088_1 /TAXON_ID=31324 /ORGANISM="Goniomonas sp, Strain m" /LENGTH=44 /DNA_ID= /DNA_START= /DNA_END= /DNA_ORIENTATION=